MGYGMTYDQTQSKIYWINGRTITRTNLTGEDDGTFKNLRDCKCYIIFYEGIYLITVGKRQSIPLPGMS